MAKVKIYLEENESPEEARDSIRKALSFHEDGNAHQEKFQQPAAQDVIDTMLSEFEKMWQTMLKEISVALDEQLP